ncbi:creatininase family protein [Haloterrigena sp. SYSU A121-1]|uniref:Creatininase family protein n=1 Tax=Haloterrigena gelatinilytica TaxID=2741724 RepID=A0A8J8GS19_9EURY|nr:creatininase family protein [Haloterrigena gelatinilytica]NUB93444.1 creatininase family protein [Haloterrigena gelatinilytica]
MTDELRNNLLEIAPVDVEEWLTRTDTALIPIGSCEKHGDHVPLGTDSYITIETVERAAEKADVPYSPLMPFGYSPHHMGESYREDGDYVVGGTITLRAETLRAVIEDIGKGLIHHGFDKLVFVSQHGSNTKVIDEVLRKLRYETGCFTCWYKTPTEREIDVVEDIVEGSAEETPGWHAGEMETAMVMAHDEDLVKMDRANEDSAHAPAWLSDEFSKHDGMPQVEFKGSENIWIPMEHHEYSDTATIGNPFRASVEEGESILDRNSSHLSAFVEEVEELDFHVPEEKRDYLERAMD